jgi:hypothetical protein
MTRKRLFPELHIIHREEAANRALYAVAPELAMELGYTPRSVIKRGTETVQVMLARAPRSGMQATLFIADPLGLLRRLT